MSCRMPFLVLAMVLAAPASAMAQDMVNSTISTSELKSDSLAPPDAVQGPDASSGKPQSILASSLLGETLYARDGKRIGQIMDIVMTPDLNGQMAIIGIGGFLGFGARDVAVPKDRIAVSHDKSGELKLTIASTREQLQQAPAFDRTALMR